MKLIKKSQPLEFKYEDVIFYVRKEVTGADKLQIALMGQVDGNKIVLRRTDLVMLLVELFVVGWDGVSDEHDKPVSYSFQALRDSFPHVHGKNVYFELFDFIGKHTGVLESSLTPVEKKTSNAEPIGSAR